MLSWEPKSIQTAVVIVIPTMAEAREEEIDRTQGAVSVRVVVRLRPARREENGGRCVRVVQPTGAVEVTPNDDSTSPQARKEFMFDGVLDCGSTQEETYELTGAPVVGRVLDGFNSTVMAYGQTGSGKTYTLGNPTNGADVFARSVTGRCVSNIFDRVDEAARVTVSYLEVYNENVYDLLGNEPGQTLTVCDDSRGVVTVRNLSEHPASSVAEVAHLLRSGGLRRHVGSTMMNSESSRSHAMCTIRIVRGDGRDGKLCLVDLAGSERARKTGAQGDRLNEGIQINKGLLVLGQVVSALAADDASKQHAPFRDSKLTRLLRDSLGGTATTVMIACIAPEDGHRDETINTLRYASRARNVANVAVRHVVATKDLQGIIDSLRRENADLKKELMKATTGTGRSRFEQSGGSTAAAAAVAAAEKPRQVARAGIARTLGTFFQDLTMSARKKLRRGSFSEDSSEEFGKVDHYDDDDAIAAQMRFTEDSAAALNDDDDEDADKIALKDHFVEAVRTLEEELTSLERLRDEAAAELKKKQNALASSGSGVFEKRRKEIETLREALRARTQTLDAKARELDGARRERDRLKSEMATARAKRVELERKLRGEAAARSKGAREAELAVRRAVRETAKSKAALAKLERAHEIQGAALRRKYDESLKRRKQLKESVRIQRDRVLARHRRQLQRDDQSAEMKRDTALDSRLEANVAADVERALVAETPKSATDNRVKIHLPPLSAADARLALRWYHAELVRLKMASQRAIRPRVSSGRRHASTRRQPSREDVEDSESSWVDDDDENGEQDDSDTEEIATKDKNELANMTVADLKTRLRSAGLKVAGRKSELVDRLREHDSQTVVVAVYDCSPEQHGELAFRKGDFILVEAKPEVGWWRGRLQKGGDVGLFPANYVREVAAIHDQQENLRATQNLITVTSKDKNSAHQHQQRVAFTTIN